jgi:hypothetical protein
LEKRVHVLKRLSWMRMIFLRVVKPVPDTRTRKRAPATIDTLALPARPITVPFTLTVSPSSASLGATIVTRVGLLVVVAGAVAVAVRRRRTAPIAKETRNRTRQH